MKKNKTDYVLDHVQLDVCITSNYSCLMIKHPVHTQSFFICSYYIINGFKFQKHYLGVGIKVYLS